MVVFRFVIVCVAAYRLTRLITYDDFPPILAARRWVIGRTGADSAWATLVTCPWCMGWWVSAGIVAATYWGMPLWDMALRALATSAAVGALAAVLDN